MRETSWISSLNHTCKKVRSDSMATIKKALMQKGMRKRMASALLVFALGSASPVHATGGHQPPVVDPQAPPPQGILTVYSERYVMEDADTPVVYRRPVALYASVGRLVGTYSNSVGDGP